MATSTPPQETPTPKHNQDSTPHPHPTFICTICWQRQPRRSKPKLLGTSARIVCRACWRAVVDLSICWVCGECIVRGDEVVSLGWCFWHRGCFGCLVCGTRLDVPGTAAGDICGRGSQRVVSNVEDKGEWGKWDGSEDEGSVLERTRCIGVELEEIPLCGVCVVETAGESTDRVLERGLETVTKFDGGLSRDRLDVISEIRDERDGEMRLASMHSVRAPRRLRGTTRTDGGLRAFSHYRSKSCMSEPLNAEDMTPLLANAADMGVSRDGSIDDGYYHTNTEMSDLSASQSPQKEVAPSIVYVSVTDPIGEPVFKPSKTEPLPKWMHLLPNNVHGERERKAKAEARINGNSHELDQMGVNYSSDGSEDRDLSASISDSTSPTPTGPARPQKQDTTSINTPRKLKAPATISFDASPKREFVSRDDTYRAYRRSNTVESSYVIAHKYPCSCPSRPQNPFPRSPYPDVHRPPLNRNEPTFYFSHRPGIDTKDNSNDDLCCALGSEEQTPRSSRTEDSLRVKSPELRDYFPLPSLSSEYLERYNPETPAARYEKYVASQPDPILNKIKRLRAEQQAAESTRDYIKEDMDDGKVKGKRVRLTDEDFRLDPRREDLNKELRNLFCEE